MDEDGEIASSMRHKLAVLSRGRAQLDKAVARSRVSQRLLFAGWLAAGDLSRPLKIRPQQTDWDFDIPDSFPSGVTQVGKYFQLDRRRTNFTREVAGGVVTFLTVGHIPQQ